MFKRIDKICRVCLEEGVLVSIFDVDDLSYKIMACAAVQVYENDGLPGLLCTICISQLDSAFLFRQRIEQSDGHLRKVLKLRSTTTPLKTEPNSNFPQYLEYPATVKCEIEVDETSHVDDTPDLDSDKCSSIDQKEVVVWDKAKKGKKGVAFSTKRENNYPKIKVGRGRKKKCIADFNETLDPNAIKIEVFQEVKKKRGRKRGTLNTKGEKRARDLTRRHMCDTCGKTFLYLSNLADHERIHTGDKPFICTVCGNRFAQSGHLMIHARTHTGVKPYQCEFCPRAFTVSHALKKHLRTHTGERPYSCSVCTKAFVTSYHLSNHFKRHTGEKNFRCDWTNCGLGFVNVSEMKRHRARHEKPMECAVKHVQTMEQCNMPKEMQNSNQFAHGFIRNELSVSYPIKVLDEDALPHTGS